MPPLPPDNPEVCKVSLIMTQDTRTFVNTFHVDKVTEWTLPEMITLAGEVRDWYVNFYRAAVPSQVSLLQVQVRKYDPIAPLAYDLNVSPPSPGIRGGSPTPRNASVTTSWRTGLAGRRFRGRIYLPGVNEPDAGDDDRISSALVNLLVSAAAELILGALTQGVLTVFHPPKDPPTPYDNTSTDVLTAVVENIIDSQRRRLPGRGR